MRVIERKQTVVVGCIARDTHAVSAPGGSNVGTVDTHVDAAVVRINIAVSGCCRLIDVIHEAIGRVGGLKTGVSSIDWHAYGKE